MSEIHVGGIQHTTHLDGTTKKKVISTVRLSSESNLDLVVSADGTKNVLAMLKQAAQEILEMEIPNPLPEQWDTIVRVPNEGTEVTITFGIRSEYLEDVEE